MITRVSSYLFLLYLPNDATNLIFAVPQQENNFDCGLFICRYLFGLVYLHKNGYQINNVSMIEDNDLFNFTQKDISRMRKEFEILLTRLTIYNSRLQQELLEEGCILIIDDAEEGDNGDGDVNSHGNVDVNVDGNGDNNAYDADGNDGSNGNNNGNAGHDDSNGDDGDDGDIPQCVISKKANGRFRACVA